MPSRGKCTGIHVEGPAGRRERCAAATCRLWCRQTRTESGNSEDEVRSKAERGGAEIRAIGDTRSILDHGGIHSILFNCLSLSTTLDVNF